MRTSEIKLQLNNAAGGRLKRNKILFYFRRAYTMKQPETVLAYTLFYFSLFHNVRRASKIRAKCKTESFKFLLDPSLLPRQHVDIICRQNRLLLSVYKIYHQYSCTKQGFFVVDRFNCVRFSSDQPLLPW